MDCELEQALLETQVPGLTLLPASQFARARSLDCIRFRKIVKTLKESCEFILIDAPAGIEKGLRNLLNAGPDQIILITTADDLCVRDMERTAQVIEAKQLPRPQLIVNRLDGELIRRHEMMPARTIAAAVDLPLLGEIPEDAVVYRSILRKKLFVSFDCEARMAVLRIAGRLLGEDIPFPDIGKGRIPFIRRLFLKDLKEVTPLERH